MNMPVFWNEMSSAVRRSGVELTTLIDSTQLWFPDIRFHDLSDYNVMAQVKM
jgi:hypothetical protein